MCYGGSNDDDEGKLVVVFPLFAIPAQLGPVLKAGTRYRPYEVGRCRLEVGSFGPGQTGSGYATAHVNTQGHITSPRP